MSQGGFVRPRGWAGRARPSDRVARWSAGRGPIQRVLVAGDGSAGLDGAARVADGLAARGGYEVAVTVAVPAEAAAREVAGRAAAAAEQASAGRAAGTAWPVSVTHGRAAVVLDHEARRRGADLIVLAVAARGTGARVEGIETALQLIRLADVPILVAGPEVERLPRRAIVLASPRTSALDAVRATLDLLDRPADLTLAYAGTPHERMDLGDGLETGRESFWDRLLEEIGSKDDVVVSNLALDDEPVRAMLREAARPDAELVAVPMPGSSLLERIILGRQAAEIVRAARCPVLITPQPSDTAPIEEPPASHSA